MSTRAERRGNKVQAATPPTRNKRGPLISAVIGIVAIAGILVYAWWRSHSAIPGAAVATNAQPTFPPLARVGSNAPSLTLRTPLAMITSDSLAGRPYLLEIFATWCPHCQRMTSVLRSLRAKFPPDRLAMVSVTGSPYAKDSTPDNFIPESQQDVDAFDREFDISWPSVYDPQLTVARTWGLDGFPTIYVVNKNGKIVYSGSGEIKAGVLVAALRKAGA